VRWIWDRPWLAAGVLALASAAAAGLIIGVLDTGNQSDAEAARADAFKTAYAQKLTQTRQMSSRRGIARGFAEGRRFGDQIGNFDGFDQGGGVAGQLLVEEQLAEAESARAVAEAELAERQANCGTIRRAPDICPTNAELESFQAAVAALIEARKPERPPGGNQKPGNGPNQNPGNGPGAGDG
jgi:hypothetical protein